MQPRGAPSPAAAVARQKRALIASWSSTACGQTGQAEASVADTSRSADGAAAPPAVTYDAGNVLEAMVPTP